jgi:hypothetical protein
VSGTDQKLEVSFSLGLSFGSIRLIAVRRCGEPGENALDPFAEQITPGRQLFEQSATLATSDEGLYEEGAAEVDMSQYTREAREEERRRAEEEEERARRGLVGDESDGE